MIFKPSSLRKLFFTYICPRFYGGAPAIPANTTTTSTVNQSPWQNPVYQALMLGTADKPGPATSMLNASRDQVEQWKAINKTGLDPAAQASLGAWSPNVPGSTAAYTNNLDASTGQYSPTLNPNAEANRVANASPIEQGAAQGGVMGLKGYASGGAPYSLTDALKRVAYFDPTTGKSTLSDFLAIQQKARELGTPEQYAQGTNAYNQALAATQALKNYKPADITANQLTQYQMQGPNAVNAPTAAASQMAGPQSWLDQGTAASYMNPYQQNVTDIQKREADRAYKQQLNELNAQAAKSGAFGGSRQAIQQSEAARNQAMLLNDIQAKGQQEAYASGMGQFNTAQNQQLQAGQANLTTAQQATLANQAAQIQAMMANQGMDYNTAVQNLQAQMGIQNTQATQQLAAQQANQSAGLQANQQNLGTAQQLGSIGQGLAGIGTAQNAAQIANLGAQGQVAQAEQNLGQSYLDAQSGNATGWLNAPTSINAGVTNVLNAQPVSGGTDRQSVSSAPAKWARGGLIKKGNVSNRGKK